MRFRCHSWLNHLGFSLVSGLCLTEVSLKLEGGSRGVHVSAMSEANSEIPRRRRSACADAAFRAELARVEQMTVEERVKAALSIRERFAWLKPATKSK